LIIINELRENPLGFEFAEPIKKGAVLIIRPSLPD
jgi:hypothetical protein